MKISMKVSYRIYMAVSFGILAALGLASAFLKQQEFSENENRYLEQYPKLTISSVLSGDYQSKFEQALGDQFAGRELWMENSTRVEKKMGLQEIAGVYLGRDGYYFAKKTQDMIDQKQYARNLHYVEYIGTQTEGKASLLLVPSPAVVLSDYLPEGAPYYDASAMYTTADTLLKHTENIDVCTELVKAKKKEQVYYRTDHHWTLRGAYTAYRTFCRKTGLKVRDYKDFAPKSVTNDFYGTMYSKVLDTDAKPDTIYVPQKIPQVQTDSDGQRGQGIYDVRKLKQKDKYAYFFGGNYGKVTIQTEKKNKKLLVIKDSFANSFVPFLFEDFGEITMIDLRYYQNSIKKLLEENAYDRVLVLYEMSNFAEDKHLKKLVH